MAYVAQIPENEQNLFGRKDPTTAYPDSPMGSGSAGMGGGSPPGVGTPTQFGSSAAKLGDYLKANQDQAAQMGSQVAGNLTQNFNEAQGAIDTGFKNFNTDIGNGLSPVDQGQVDKAAANPTEFAKNPDNVKQFQGWWNDQYSGPQNFESTAPYADVNDRVNKAVQNAALTKTPAGLGTYLNNNMGAQDTTEGMRGLDTALLTGNKTSREAIQNAASDYSGLNSYLAKQTGQADQNVAGAKENAAASKEAIRKQFQGAGGVIPTFQSGIDASVAKAQADAATRAQRAKDVLGGKDILQTFDQQTQALSDLGMTKADIDKLTREAEMMKGFDGSFDVNQWLTQQVPEAQINRGNFANADQYAEAAALAQLTGQDMSGFLNSGDAAKAGTANLNMSQFDKTGAQEQLTASLKDALAKPIDLQGVPLETAVRNGPIRAIIQKYIDAAIETGADKAGGYSLAELQKAMGLPVGIGNPNPGSPPVTTPGVIYPKEPLPGVTPGQPLTNEQVTAAMNQWMKEYPEPSHDDPEFYNWIAERQAYLKSIGG